jgi:hypothetical protein
MDAILRPGRALAATLAPVKFARLLAPLCALLLAACGSAAVDGPPPTLRATGDPPKDEWIDALTAPPPPLDTPGSPAPVANDDGPGKDFIEEARILYRVAACASDDPIPSDLDARIVKAHCDELRPRMLKYRTRYVAVATPFLSQLLPPGPQAPVVYPFGGGDLATALTTYPDAKDITTISLELAGDPRRIHGMTRDDLDRSLAKLRRQMSELFFIDDFSRSETLKRTQRGDIPGELVFFLFGLAIHGYEPVSLRYFNLGPDGSVHYLTQKQIAESDHVLAKNRKDTWWPPDFAESFANAEIAFRPVPGGPAANGPDAGVIRVHRHIAQNLADDALEKASLIAYLEKKGNVNAILKAASYLVWLDGFSMIRNYLLGHASFTISDSTGIPPSFASKAGFVQETYGTFTGSLIPASTVYNKELRKLWRSQPKRKLPFKFGYLSGKESHLMVTKKAAQ